jgi:hypothetical protein
MDMDMDGDILCSKSSHQVKLSQVSQALKVTDMSSSYDESLPVPGLSFDHQLYISPSHDFNLHGQLKTFLYSPIFLTLGPCIQSCERHFSAVVLP